MKIFESGEENFFKRVALKQARNRYLVDIARFFYVTTQAFVNTP